ncbi:MAG: hypothetical protein K0Q43_3113 [Ramlibacter sp.]|nr:hypothetical protein [Ramlibacter sp.]
MPKSKPPYAAEFRQQIIELARIGRTPAELSREFGPRPRALPIGSRRMRETAASPCQAKKA